MFYNYKTEFVNFYFDKLSYLALKWSQYGVS